MQLNDGLTTARRPSPMEYKATTAAWAKIPVDIITKIAFSIPDAVDLFAFLEVLRPYNLLVSHSSLWPNLRINSKTSAHLSEIEEIVKYYANVSVEDDWIDAEWLKTHLNPMTNIEWDVYSFPIPTETLDDLYDVRITRLNLYLDGPTPFPWMEVLSRFPYLTSLEVQNDNDDLGGLYEFIATSNQITELRVFPDCDMTASNVKHLTKWFRQQPVRVFEHTGISFDENDFKLPFFEAMFNCQTLDILKLPIFDWSDLKFTSLKCTARSLELASYNWTPSIYESFANQLVGSRVACLSLHYVFTENVDGLEYLVRALPRTSIKHLRLTDLRIENPTWCTVASLLQKCKLNKLTLEATRIPSDFAQSLAVAIQGNNTLSELVLSTEDIAMDDVRRLMQSLSHPSRLVKTKRIILISTRDAIGTVIKDSSVKSVKEFPNEDRYKITRIYTLV
ncbi:hypothetical protein AC1031_016544 [Aphanomyces cochlioides]|nr:hypothetical protein AC1031_016544 [Aphanomyces cochlioides]